MNRDFKENNGQEDYLNMVRVVDAKKFTKFIVVIIFIFLMMVIQTLGLKAINNKKQIRELSYKFYKEVFIFQAPVLTDESIFSHLLDIKKIIKFSHPIFNNSAFATVYQDSYYYEDDVIIIPSEDNSNGPKSNNTKQNEEENFELNNLLNKIPKNNIKNYNIELMNQTNYKIDIKALLDAKPKVFSGKKPSILIYHTHTTESYSSSVNFLYKTIDSTQRTLNFNYNIVRVGEELRNILEKKYGYKVYHSKDINDYPEYRGSYARSLKVVEKYKNKHPDIKVFIDLHRDAIGEGSKKVKASTVAFGKEIAKIMLVIGTDKLGLYHPYWRQNLAFAVNIQKNLIDLCPSIVRPINISAARYNQHISPYAILIEIGSNGNILEEALKSCAFVAEALDRTIMGR